MQPGAPGGYDSKFREREEPVDQDEKDDDREFDVQHYKNIEFVSSLPRGPRPRHVARSQDEEETLLPVTNSSNRTDCAEAGVKTIHGRGSYARHDEAS